MFHEFAYIYSFCFIYKMGGFRLGEKICEKQCGSFCSVDERYEARTQVRISTGEIYRWVERDDYFHKIII